jgi:hypothetical protein
MNPVLVTVVRSSPAVWSPMPIAIRTPSTPPARSPSRPSVWRRRIAGGARAAEAIP